MAVNDKKVVAVGSALVDLLVKVDASWPERNGVKPGGMELTASVRIDELLHSIDQLPEQVAGGSACNTVVGTAQLGIPSRFIGRLGDDARGAFFVDSLVDVGLEVQAIVADEPTGTVLSVITPDAQRSMFTSLAASAGLAVSDIDNKILEGCGVLHLEGYLAVNRPVFEKVVEMAQQAGVPISLDLASFQTVRDCFDTFQKALPAVEILIANEDEALAFTGKEPQEALEEMARLVPIAVVKLGKEGALIARGEERVRVEALVVDAVDTTGAGDLWASGFLAGWLRGVSLEKAGQLASRCAAKVVEIVGAHLPAETWRELRADLP